MAIRTIVTSENDLLRKKSRRVEKIDERMIELLDDMIETMYDSDGVGLAAPQVGILRRVVVIDVGEGVIELINPEIIEVDGEQIGSEGCLSVPQVSGDVSRPKHVKIKGLNRQGKLIEYEGDDLLARAFCHEMDHLEGILFIDKAKNIEK